MSYQARAAVLREYGGDVTIETIEVDEPADNEVLVRTAACGVCHSDLHFKQGAMPHFPVPTVMGHEAAGVVEKVGKNVRDLQPGDHVVACNKIGRASRREGVRQYVSISVVAVSLQNNRQMVLKTENLEDRLRGNDTRDNINDDIC